MLPEIERQQELGKEVAFRADAAFAKPEIYEALEERGVKYAIRIPSQRQIGAGHRRVVDPTNGPPNTQAGDLVQEVSLPGGELEDGAARGGEGEVPFWGTGPPRGIHCHEPGDGQLGGGAVLQQARDAGAVDQGM